MIFIDASALIALLGDEPAAPGVEKLLRSKEQAAISSVNLAESIDVLQRRKSVHVDHLRIHLSPMLSKNLTVIDVNADHGWKAATVRAAHYHRKTCPLSLEDCFLLASATEGDSIATTDKHVAAVAKAEGIEVLDL